MNHNAKLALLCGGSVAIVQYLCSLLISPRVESSLINFIISFILDILVIYGIFKIFKNQKR